MANISIDGLGDAIKKELELYSESVMEGIKGKTKEVMDDLVAETQNTAPIGKRRKHYKNSITSELVFEDYRTIKYRWYVKGSDYRLSHLLNNGHAIRGGGRYPGTQFIAAAEKKALDDFEKGVEDVIKNGG